MIGGVIFGIIIANIAADRIYWTLSVGFVVVWIGMTFISYRWAANHTRKGVVETDERTDVLWHRVSMNLLVLLLFILPAIFLVVSEDMQHTTLPISWVLIYCVFCALTIITSYEIVKRR